MDSKPPIQPIRTREGQPSLPEVDFTKPPKTIEEYKLGDKVTRENFVGFLIQSFSISRGSPKMQLIFFMWLQEKYGLDYVTLLSDFNKNGSWDCLSEEERSIFYTEFSKVKKHRRQAADIESELSGISKLITANTYEAKVTQAKFFDFYTIDSLADFSRSVDSYFTDRYAK